MTGPEHYQKAEQRLLMAWEEDRNAEDVSHLVAEAQVHATLALAAATAMQTSVMAHRDDINDVDVDNWHDVAGPTPRGGADRG